MPPLANASLSEWLKYIEAIHPTEIEMGLSRLNKVAQRLLSFQTNPCVFTVAGTNGKGTTTAVLSALGVKAGKSVGWYSSPHLMQFNERVRVNQIPVSDVLLVKAFSAVEDARNTVSLSYFEYTTLAAFWIFEHLELEVWVLEVGLGGRLDAVNVIDADVAVLTNVGLDHQGFLGDDVESIGFEKAHIARAGHPIVLGSSDLPDSVFDVFRELKATVFPFGDAHGVDRDQFYFEKGRLDQNDLSVPTANAASAAQAFALSGIELPLAQYAEALTEVHVPGRMQPFKFRGSNVIIDVGHNPHAGRYIAGQLGETKHHLVLGMLSDKDVAGFVASLSEVSLSLNLFNLDVPRGLSAKEFGGRISEGAALYNTLEECVIALTEAYPGEPLFIGGSFYTVCDALTLLEK